VRGDKKDKLQEN
jgi:hypothetical protein